MSRRIITVPCFYDEVLLRFCVSASYGSSVSTPSMHTAVEAMVHTNFSYTRLALAFFSVALVASPFSLFFSGSERKRDKKTKKAS